MRHCLPDGRARRVEELTPPRRLAEYVACLWMRRVMAGEPPGSGLVVPDACIDIVWLAGHPPQVAGPNTGPVPFLVPSGTAIVGVRFHPARAPAGLGVPASDLLDARVPLEAVWSTAAVRRLQEAGEERGEKVRLLLLLEELERRLVGARPEDAAVDAVIRWAVAGSQRSRPVATDLGVSDRQLLRRFRARLGYGPRTLLRVLRFQRFLTLASHMPGAGLARLAAEAGYADQPHMTREVKRLGGTTPSELLQSP